MKNKITDYETAKYIMGKNIIGIEEIKKYKKLSFLFPNRAPEIMYSPKELEEKKDDYLLILGIDRFQDGTDVTIRRLKSLYGMDPQKNEPCFYNQDWYDKESFIDVPIQTGWYLVRKRVFEDSRAVQPDELIKKHEFPLAITCVYSFFLAWELRNIKLWYHDFIWCKDTDHNGDRIYVGKYHDIDGINRNGFSIHRHLSLRPCYGCID